MGKDSQPTPAVQGEVVDENENQAVRRNMVIFGILTILFQIAAGLLYGFLIRPQEVPDAPFTATLLLNPIFMTCCYALLVVAGFGLLVSFLKRIVWSGLGFTLLITAFTLEYYFLINAAIGWAALAEGSNRGTPQFQTEAPEDLQRYYFTLSSAAGGAFGNYILEAFKAALANVVAFSCILGRAGPLEAWFIVFVGTVGYELNRNLLTKYGFDGPGSFHIFIYGGFLGLVASILLKIREPETQRHPNYTANKFSSTVALLGTIIIWVFFPLLSMDPAFEGAPEGFTVYTGPINTALGLGAATLTSFSISALINGKLQIRDIIYGPVAGGIAVATASVYIVEPVYAFAIGSFGALVQVFIMNLIEKRVANHNNIFSTVSFSLFGVMGILGACFAAMCNAIVRGNSEGFTYVQSTDALPFFTDLPIFEFWIGLLAVAFGIGFGLIAGLFILICASHTREDHFTDTTYWVDDDGISFPGNRPAGPVVVGDNVEMEFFEGDNQIKNIHAYL